MNGWPKTIGRQVCCKWVIIISCINCELAIALDSDILVGTDISMSKYYNFAKFFEICNSNKPHTKCDYLTASNNNHLCKYKHANHMTMVTSGQIMSWSDYLKTKGNVNIKMQDLCETLIVYILLSTFQLVHMVLTVNKPDIRRFIAWIESADWNPWDTFHQSRTNQ